MTVPSKLKDWGEARRLKALELREDGLSQRAIAAKLGVTRGAVSQWLRRAELEGRDSLRHRKDPGRTSRLTPDQLERLAELLARSPDEVGLDAEEWTRGLVKELILREFGVAYHPGHISRLWQAYGPSRTR